MATKKMETKKTEAPRVKAVVISDLPLNIRSGKTTEDNNIVGQLQPGTEVEILKDGKIWCKIEKGYVMRQFLAF